MTTKLPEVGKRYKHKFLNITVEVSEVGENRMLVKNHCDIREFISNFQELPDQPTEEKLMKQFGEWQPIETAPKNALPVLLIGGEYKMELSKPEELDVAMVAQWQCDKWKSTFYCYYEVEALNPTHWMPLPKPPHPEITATNETINLKKEGEVEISKDSKPASHDFMDGYAQGWFDSFAGKDHRFPHARITENHIKVTFQTPDQPELGRLSPTWSNVSEVDKALGESKQVLRERYSNPEYGEELLVDTLLNLITALETEKTTDLIALGKMIVEERDAYILKKLDKEVEKMGHHYNAETEEYVKRDPKTNMKEGSDDLVKVPLMSGYSDHCDSIPLSKIIGLPPELRVGAKEEVKSIWKPVSELPELDPRSFCCYVKLENDSQIIVAKYFAGEFYTQIFYPDMSFEKFRTTKISKEAIESFCALTDYINNTEERLSKLESNK